MFANILKFGVVCVGLTLATAPVLADPVPGKLVQKDVVQANSTDSYTVKLRSDEPTRIRLSGDGDTCLELRVYDENGNLVASDTRGFGDDREVTITPKWTGKFTVKIRNLGFVYNRYVLVLD